MKRFYVLVGLMLLGSPACAGDSFSFVIGGHRVHIEASRHCRSASCVSISIPGVYEQRGWRDRDDDDAGDLSPAPVAAPVAPPASPSSMQPVACVPPATPPHLVAAVASSPSQPQQIQSPPVQPITTATVMPPAPAVMPAGPALPPVPLAPRISKAVHQEPAQPVDTPLGDWQTEGNGLVRIEPCGQALCGYVLDPSTNAQRETVLVGMKSKTNSEWYGNIYSRDSGNTYYATMTLKGPDSLWVEACALGRFFCSGNAWRRIGATPPRLATSRQAPAQP